MYLHHKCYSSSKSIKLLVPTLFTYKEGDEATYFVSEGPGDQELDVGPSGGVVTTLEKGEVIPQGYESEDVKILKIPEARRPITEPTAEEPTMGVAFAKTTAAAYTVPAKIALEDMPSCKVDYPINPTMRCLWLKLLLLGSPPFWRLQL